MDLLDYYRGTLTWRRLAVLIRHFQTKVGSALFDAIEASVQPERDDLDDVEDLLPHQIFQMLRWTSLDEGQRQIVIAINHMLTAWSGVPIDAPLHPWALDSSDSVTARNKARADAYNSPEAVAARAVVAPPNPGEER